MLYCKQKIPQRRELKEVETKMGRKTLQHSHLAALYARILEVQMLGLNVVVEIALILGKVLAHGAHQHRLAGVRPPVGHVLDVLCHL